MAKATFEPINATEWIDLIDLICSPSKGLWPGSSRLWQTADTHGSEVHEMFRPYPADVIRPAILELFSAGSQNAPSPSKVLAKTKEIAANRFGDLALEFDGPCSHMNTGVMFDINTNDVVQFCSRGSQGGCDWETHHDFESLAAYHAHHDKLEEIAADKIGSQPDTY